jgi:hypothetical protein
MLDWLQRVSNMASLTSPSLQCPFQSHVFPPKSLGCHAKITHMKHTVISQQASAVLGLLRYSGSLVAVSTKTQGYSSVPKLCLSFISMSKGRPILSVAQFISLALPWDSGVQ